MNEENFLKLVIFDTSWEKTQGSQSCRGWGHILKVLQYMTSLLFTSFRVQKDVLEFWYNFSMRENIWILFQERGGLSYKQKSWQNIDLLLDLQHTGAIRHWRLTMIYHTHSNVMNHTRHTAKHNTDNIYVVICSVFLGLDRDSLKMPCDIV